MNRAAREASARGGDYCFSHEGYRAECRRIVTALADRYGDHPAIVMWQTDNEQAVMTRC